MNQGHVRLVFQFPGQAQHVIAGVRGHESVEEFQISAQEGLQDRPSVGAIEHVEVSIAHGCVLEPGRPNPQREEPRGMDHLLRYIRTDGSDDPAAPAPPLFDLAVG